jgi:hypothetical protein
MYIRNSYIQFIRTILDTVNFVATDPDTKPDIALYKPRLVAIDADTLTILTINCFFHGNVSSLKRSLFHFILHMVT